jgi:hypothetical protein
MRIIQLIDLYFRVCEVYDNQMINHCFRHTKNGSQPDFTDQEVLTCYLFASGWQKCDGPKACYEYIYHHYLDCFPRLPAFETFNHRLNRLADALPIFVQACFAEWKSLESSLPTSTKLTDSFPVITAAGYRTASSCTLLSDKGRCATKSMWFHGIKIHAAGWEQAGTLPIPDTILITPASVHDKKAQEDNFFEMKNVVLVADKAYEDSQLKQCMAQNSSELLTPPRYGRWTTEEEKQRFGASNRLQQTLISKLRQPIETFFSWLIEHTNIQKASKVRSYRGLLIHVYGKIAAAICRHKLAVI